MTIRIKDICGNDEILKDSVDWALSYGVDRSDTGAILLVLEVQPYEAAAVGMPQLLVCMAAVHEARQNRIDRSVFGMVFDSREFRFAFLDENKKLVVSRPFTGLSHNR